MASVQRNSAQHLASNESAMKLSEQAAETCISIHVVESIISIQQAPVAGRNKLVENVREQIQKPLASGLIPRRVWMARWSLCRKKRLGYSSVILSMLCGRAIKGFLHFTRSTHIISVYRASEIFPHLARAASVGFENIHI